MKRTTPADSTTLVVVKCPTCEKRLYLVERDRWGRLLYRNWMRVRVGDSIGWRDEEQATRVAELIYYCDHHGDFEITWDTLKAAIASAHANGKIQYLRPSPRIASQPGDVPE
jgi:hypothetical protein